MQHAGARRYDYGLRINKSLAMEPRICGVPPAQVRTDWPLPAHSAVHDQNCYSGATEVLILAALSPNPSHRLVRLETEYLRRIT